MTSDDEGDVEVRLPRSQASELERLAGLLIAFGKFLDAIGTLRRNWWAVVLGALIIFAVNNPDKAVMLLDLLK